jgi:hypothetical protein
VREDNRAFSTGFQNAEQLIEEVYALPLVVQVGQMFQKMAAMRLINRVIFPRPRASTDIQNNVYALHRVLIYTKKAFFLVRAATQINLY